MPAIQRRGTVSPNRSAQNDGTTSIPNEPESHAAMKAPMMIPGSTMNCRSTVGSTFR